MLSMRENTCDSDAVGPHCTFPNFSKKKTSQIQFLENLWSSEQFLWLHFFHAYFLKSFLNSDTCGKVSRYYHSSCLKPNQKSSLEILIGLPILPVVLTDFGFGFKKWIDRFSKSNAAHKFLVPLKWTEEAARCNAKKKKIFRQHFQLLSPRIKVLSIGLIRKANIDGSKNRNEFLSLSFDVTFNAAWISKFLWCRRAPCEE